MRIPLSWLREYVDLPESAEELRPLLDELGLVVDAVETVGEGLDDVVVARVDEIRAIDGADKIRLVTVDAGAGPVEVVCGAWNFEVGQHVPLAPVGAVLPDGTAIARRKMKGITSNGMLCSGRELRMGDDHAGLLVLDSLMSPRVGQRLAEALGIEPDTVFDITVEGNIPDAWSVVGVARNLATKLGRTLREPVMAAPESTEATSAYAAAGIDAPDLCGRLTVSVLRNVIVAPSPAWVVRRLQNSGMRAISNVVDASNLVMLEMGQPTHPYDAHKVADRTLRVRRARPGETLVTLDGVERQLATPGRGLGDTGEDCVIVDGHDDVLGLAGIMGGATSEISAATTEVLVEAANFESMGVARSSKRHSLRSEASARFERGVDPELALRAVGRFVAVLRESVADLEWLADPLDERGTVATPPTVELRPDDVRRALGVELDPDHYERDLTGLGFVVTHDGDRTFVTAPTARPDIRGGIAGRADVIEEVARLYGYGRLPRHAPTWPEPGGLTPRQVLRRRVRDTLVDLGVFEAWTPTLVSDEQFDLLNAGQPRVRITNPLSSDESVLRATMVTGLVMAWGRNVDRGNGDVMLGEFGVVFTHPDLCATPRLTRGGAGGTVELVLPGENERVTIVLGRPDDDAARAVALWSVVAERLGLERVVLKSVDQPMTGWHPTRSASLVDARSGAVLGVVGEIDPDFVTQLAPSAGRRVGLVDLDLDALADSQRASRSADFVSEPSRYPSASVDLAFVTPRAVAAYDLQGALRAASDLVESIELFDVYEGSSLPPGTRSLAFRVSFSSRDATLSDSEIGAHRERLISAAAGLGATLR
ncbi:MAG TPA: phenylalanine--tRNA ligase subunit beta [Acidimicrobiales bacterium]|nr:phenylalanine--tRNA ligase subunit beta [Acidimicrobiales bacterium]